MEKKKFVLCVLFVRVSLDVCFLFCFGLVFFPNKKKGISRQNKKKEFGKKKRETLAPN
jgi:hypothetical protein